MTFMKRMIFAFVILFLFFLVFIGLAQSVSAQDVWKHKVVDITHELKLDKESEGEWESVGTMSLAGRSLVIFKRKKK